MTRNRAAFIVATTTLSALSFWQTVVVAAPPTDDKPGAPAGAVAGKSKESLPTQASLASKTAKFGMATAAEVKSAVDAHDLAKAKTMVDKPITFVGTVTKVFAPKSNKVVILNFDKDYKSALTAVVFTTTFGKFPDLKTLEGKKVVVSGKVKSFHEGEEVALDAPTQIKIVK